MKQTAVEWNIENPKKVDNYIVDLGAEGVSLAWYGDEESAKQSLAFAAAYDKESPQTPLFQLAIARKENNNSDAELYKRKYEEACLLKGTMHQKEHAFGAEAFVRKFGKNLF